jgi:hypothetical protein
MSERQFPTTRPRPKFTPEEKADIQNREARDAYWNERIAAEDRALAEAEYPTLPVEERAKQMHARLHPEEGGNK